MSGDFAMTSAMNHYTDAVGHKAIRALPVWHFRAGTPRTPTRERGCYFTTLTPDTRNLAQRIRVSREKTQFLFSFDDAGDLQPIAGGRGAYIFWSRNDYLVAEDRQRFEGPTPGRSQT